MAGETGLGAWPPVELVKSLGERRQGFAVGRLTVTMTANGTKDSHMLWKDRGLALSRADHSLL